MKISKQRLKQIIKEEMSRLDEEGEPAKLGLAKTSSSEMTKMGRGLGKQTTKGFTNQERGVVKQFSELLIKIAQEDNLVSGTYLSRLSLVHKQLQDIFQKSGKGAQPEQPAAEEPTAAMNLPEV